MIKTNHLAGQCSPCRSNRRASKSFHARLVHLAQRCANLARFDLAYHSRYTLKSSQVVVVIRRKQRKGTFCGRYGTAFYDLKTPEGRATTICAGKTAH